MKKITALCLIAVLMASLFSGCASNKQETDNQKQESLTQETGTENSEIPTNTQIATVTEIHSADIITVSGTLIEESFEYPCYSFPWQHAYSLRCCNLYCNVLG